MWSPTIRSSRRPSHPRRRTRSPRWGRSACCRGAGRRADQLEPVAPRVLGVEAPGDRVVVGPGDAGAGQALGELVERVDLERRVRLRGGLEVLLHADVELLPADLEPHAAAASQRLRLLELREAEHPAAERPRLVLAVRRRRDLDVIETGDHRTSSASSLLENANPGCGPPSTVSTRRPCATTPRPWGGVGMPGRRD